MNRLLRSIGTLLKWAILAIVGMEVVCFLTITASNFVLYGQSREGSRAVYDAHSVFLHSSGVRPTTNNMRSENPALNKTIWLFGGSTMRGATEFDDRTIPSYLAQILNSRGEPLHFTVINFGVDSFNGLLETKYLQKLLIENADLPDIIIFYDGANESKYFLEHRDPHGHHGYRRVRGLIESYYLSWFGLLKPINAALYASFSKELYDKIHQVFIPLELDDPALGKMVELAEKRYDHVHRISSCYSADFILFWQPMLWIERCQAPTNVRAREKGLILDADRFETVRRNFGLPCQALAERLKDKPYFVDFRDALCERKVAAYQPDGVHMTDDGRRIIAREMARVLRERLSGDDSNRGFVTPGKGPIIELRDKASPGRPKRQT